MIDLSVLRKGYRPIPGAAYELVERLDDGNSGFGAVWKAWNERLHRSAVFKFCKNPLDEKSGQTLHNELRLVREIDHPGIVKLQDEYLDASIPFLVYEYIEGIDLSKLLIERFEDGPLSPDEAAAVILKIVELVAVAHSRPKPIVHRDLKPQNILVANAHDLVLLKELGAAPDLSLVRFMVMDFGIGAHSRDGRGTVSVDRSLGPMFDGFSTYMYASPQQRRGLPAAEADDIYGLGVMWYELLVGRLGHGAPSGGRWRHQLAVRGATVPQIEALEACLEESRDHRIPNAVELAKQIRVVYPKSVAAPSLSGVLNAAIHTQPTVEGIWLDRVESLSAQAAAALANWKGMDLSLNGLEHFPVDVAEAIAKWGSDHPFPIGLGVGGLLMAYTEGRKLHLNGLTSLSVEAAEAIAKRKGGTLYLDGLASLPLAVATALAKWNGWGLSLGGLTNVPVDVADALATWKGRALFLSGLNQLPMNVAVALAK